MDRLEMTEEYNEKGICVKRSINGHELPADTEPSVVILKNLTSVNQKMLLTKEEVKNIYGVVLL